MFTSEAADFLLELSLWAIVIGCMAGFLFSRVLEKLLDLVLYRIRRRERIEAARLRDHSRVPAIK